MSSKVITVTLATLTFFTTALHAQDSAVKEPSSEKTQSSFQPFTGKLARKSVRLRLKPDLDSPIIREMNRDDLVLIDGEKEDFYATVPPKGLKGYVFRSFILDNTVEGMRVNIRLQPSVDAPVLGQLNTGDKIEGMPSVSHPKWFEIELPSTLRLWVSKNLVNSIGSPEVYVTMQERQQTAQKLLNETCLLSQAEIHKPFLQIDAERVMRGFNQLACDYQDFPTQAKKAQEMLGLFQEAYLQKKLAYLESQAEQTSQAFINKQALFDAEVNACEQRLCEIDKKLHRGSTLILDQNEEFSTLPIPSVAYQSITDKMRLWEPIEETLYLSWNTVDPEKSIDDFYRSQESEALTLTGIIEPFTRPVKNRPGDYLLRDNQLPVAYLYSTKVNLQEKVGQQITIKAAPRPSNHFAFPAYFVLSVE